MAEVASDVKVVALLTTVESQPSVDSGKIADWLVKVMMAGAKSPGFWSAEIIPPDALTGDTKWKLLQRYSSDADAKRWQQSEQHKKVFANYAAVTGNGSKPVHEEITTMESSFGNVATAIATDVKPGMEDRYFEWEAKIQDAQAKSPGYRGSYLQPPAPDRPGQQWATLLRFDKPENLQKWFESPLRLKLIEEANQFVKATKFQSMSNSFPGWFPVDEKTGQSPPTWKMSMLVLLGLFPVVMLEIRFLSPLLTALNPAVSSFLNLVLSVALTSYVTNPLFVDAFKWWMYPEKPDSAVDSNGILIIAALYAAEIAALWTLLLK